MSKNNNLWYQVRITTISILTLFFLICLWYTVINWSINHKDSIINDWTDKQYIFVENSIKATELLPFEDTSQFERAVVDNVIKKFSFSKYSYAFFYNRNSIIFEQNDNITKDFKDKPIINLFNYWSYEGGEHLGDVLDLIEAGKSGSDYFIKKHSIGKEHVSLITFYRNNERFILGISTPEVYILSKYNYWDLKNIVFSFSAIYTFVLILFAFSFCFSTYKYRHKVASLSGELADKSEKIAELNAMASENESRLKSLVIRDPLTGAYNRRFIDRCLVKLEPKNFLPVSMLMTDVNGLLLINNTFGDAAGDELLKDIANILNSVCTPNDIVTRYGDDEFLMVMANAGREKAEEIAEKLIISINSKYWKKMPVTLSIGIGSKASDDISVFDALEETKNNLKKDKLSSESIVRSGTVNMLKKILEERSIETHNHCERMKHYTTKLAKALGLTDKEIEELNLLAWLHDIGKIAIPDSILYKQGKLTDYEIEIMKTHPELGYNIALSSPDLAPIAKYILEHHERWDGTGYPQGLKGTEITLQARILAIADAFDAMVNKRSYKNIESVDEAIKDIERNAGTQFDPFIAEKFIKILKEEITN